MPNGADKNFIRLCFAIEGFRIRYNAWPTAIRLREGVITNLRHILGPEAFARVKAKLRLVPDEAFMVAVDEAGHAYDYEKQGIPEQEPDIHARDWLGVEALDEFRYDHDFAAALHVAAQPNYLGNPSVVETGYLVELWNNAFLRWEREDFGPEYLGKGGGRGVRTCC